VSEKPRVLIADDHPPTRMGVRMALERDGMEVCAEAFDAKGALEAAKREHPDACLLDVHMPGGGPAAASSITAQLPDTVILMLSVSREEKDLLESLRRGAVGYLLKDMNPSRLSSAVRAALHGEAMVPRTLLPHLLEELRDVPHSESRAHALPGLTRRQREVLTLMKEGAGTGEIADRLLLSQVTVRRHISTIMARLGASSRAEAIQLATMDESGESPIEEES
jgi:two-component system NarL family response regulator